MTMWTTEELDAVLRKGHVRIAADTSKARLVKLMDDPEDARIQAAERRERKKATQEAAEPEKPAKTQPKAKKRHPRKWNYEEMLAEQLKAAGIERFVREYRWHPKRRFRGDIVFTLPVDRLIVEIDGAAHRIKGRFYDTIERNQQALQHGWRLLPVSTRQVRTGEACELIQKVLG